jgi:hypothetical protein
MENKLAFIWIFVILLWFYYFRKIKNLNFLNYHLRREDTLDWFEEGIIWVITKKIFKEINHLNNWKNENDNLIDNIKILLTENILLKSSSSL